MTVSIKKDLAQGSYSRDTINRAQSSGLNGIPASIPARIVKPAVTGGGTSKPRRVSN